MDNFNRPDENPLSDGGKWGAISSGGLKVVTNQVACTKSTTCDAWRNDQLYGLDQEASVTIATMPGTGNAVRVYARLQRPGGYEGYMLRFQQNSGTDQVFVERIDGGTVVGLGTLSQDFAAGNKLKIRAVGSKIEAWRYDGTVWTKLGEASDSTYTGVGHVGVGLRGTSGRLDDFAAGTLLEPTPDPSPVLDTFNRPDENPLSDAGRWTSSIYAGNEHQLRVVSNQLTATWHTDTAWRSDQQYSPDQEAWVTIAVKPGNGNAVRVYARLQAPGSSSYDGYMLRYQQNSGTDQVFVERIDNGVITTLTTLNREFSINDKLRIRAIGSSIQAWRYDGRGWQYIGVATDGTYPGPGYIGVGLRNASGRLNDFGGGSALPFPSSDASPLLAQYVPELRLDFQEDYWPDSAATITDNYVHRNELLDDGIVVLATSDPNYPADLLSLDYIRPTYPTGTPADGFDKVDEANDDRVGDAQAMHANPLYANKVYGRELPVVGGTILQYWLFYYHNPKTFVTVGEHEGDWEMIQVRLDSSGTPAGATYAQHDYSEYCPWDRVELSQSGRPVVYVAHESHASYFWSGDHQIIESWPGDYWDYADGMKTPPVVPSPSAIASPPLWMLWPGKWGGSGTSPQAPPLQDKWLDPADFESGAVPCTEPGSYVVQETPSPPQIEAQRVGDSVVIDYRLDNGRGAAPWLLVTTVDGPNDRYSSTSERTLVEGVTAGRVVQPVYLSESPLQILARVRAKNGARSSLVVVPVRE